MRKRAAVPAVYAACGGARRAGNSARLSMFFARARRAGVHVEAVRAGPLLERMRLEILARALATLADSLGSGLGSTNRDAARFSGHR